MMDVEVAELLNSAESPNLLEDLSRLQALVLYQIIRLLHGDLEQRLIAEYQEQAIEALSLQILLRVNTERTIIQTTYHDWLIAEMARRTTMVAYLLYCVYAIHTIGVSAGFTTMIELPVSSHPELWESGQTFSPQFDIAVTYDAYTRLWAANPWKQLKPFERMLMVPCKGLDKVNSYVLPAVS
jgi:hypothetical protein